MYSIGEVSKMFQISISTLRYYDKEGLLLHLDRNEAGVRVFNEQSLEAIRLIECLKKSGLKISDIRDFMKWCKMGDETILRRKEMFEHQKESIHFQIQELQEALDMINFKCWYYEKALEAGNEKSLKNMIPHHLPKDIKRLYEKIHS